MFANNNSNTLKKSAVSPDSISSKHLTHNPDDIAQVKQVIRDTAKRFQHKFLARTKPYIVGNTPTIADLLAYPELAQIPMIMDIHYTEWGEELSLLRMWLEKMEQLDFHDDVHGTVFKIGRMYKSKL